MPVSPSGDDTILDTYSEQASAYDMEANQRSCWGSLARVELNSLSIRPGCQRVVDVGCGTGWALVHLASRLTPTTRLVGIEPAPGMRTIACERTSDLPNVAVLDGRFEAMPLASESVDHLYSIHAFHWVRQVNTAIAEIGRVLAPNADLDLFFAGRGTGQEFIAITSDILRRYLGLARWIQSAKLRNQLTLEQAREAFRDGLPGRGVEVREMVETHFDTLEGHWAWWVRIQGHFADLEPAARDDCFGEIRRALRRLQTDAGIPYTTRILHVSTRHALDTAWRKASDWKTCTKTALSKR
jgi:ubiquinone/menaquinone biosynthesis C-methylase UbiE